MRMRGLLIAAVVLAALSGLVWWSNKEKAAEASKPSADASPKLLSIPESDITKIEIRKTGAEPTVLAKNQAGKWAITAPKPLNADQDSVSSVVNTVSSLATDRLIEEKAADLGQYGLTSPALQVTVTKKDGKAQELLVGDETPTQSGFFATVKGDPRVFTIASFNKTSVDKTSNDLRDKRLLTFDQDKLLRIELAAKGQPVEFGKNSQNDWQIVKPGPYRADSLQVDELIRKLKDTKMDTSVSEADAKKIAASFGSGTRIATVKITDSSGTQQIEVRKDKENNYEAKSSVVEGIYKVPSDVGDALNKSIDDFRSKKLFDFGYIDPTKMDLRDGARQASYSKSGEKWVSGSKQMDSASVQAVVDKLRDLSAIKFVDKGFTTPVVEAAVTSNDGKRVEKVAISKDGNSWFAKRENEPSIYELDGKVVEELQKAIAGVKEAAPAKPAKK